MQSNGLPKDLEELARASAVADLDFLNVLLLEELRHFVPVGATAPPNAQALCLGREL